MGESIFIPGGRYVRDHGFKNPEQVIRCEAHRWMAEDDGWSGIIPDHWDFRVGPALLVFKSRKRSADAPEMEYVPVEITAVGQFVQEQLSVQERANVPASHQSPHAEVTLVRWRARKG